MIGEGTVQIESGAGSVQVKTSVPVKPLARVTLTVAFTLAPGLTWKLPAVGLRTNCAGIKLFQAVASLSASTEPRPVTKL